MTIREGANAQRRVEPKDGVGMGFRQRESAFEDFFTTKEGAAASAPRSHVASIALRLPCDAPI
ncbi:MAG: hypothetical protein JST00_32550 [Deltaproteobacteria bacterium]|nr:hypothetical protein [Deltaproteobacteria bacterium]